MAIAREELRLQVVQSGTESDIETLTPDPQQRMLEAQDASPRFLLPQLLDDRAPSRVWLLEFTEDCGIKKYAARKFLLGALSHVEHIDFVATFAFPKVYIGFAEAVPSALLASQKYQVLTRFNDACMLLVREKRDGKRDTKQTGRGNRKAMAHLRQAFAADFRAASTIFYRLKVSPRGAKVILPLDDALRLIGDRVQGNMGWKSLNNVQLRWPKQRSSS